MIEWRAVLDVVKRYGPVWVALGYLLFWTTQTEDGKIEALTQQINQHVALTNNLASALILQQNENKQYRETTIRLWTVICKAQSNQTNLCDAIAAEGLR